MWKVTKLPETMFLGGGGAGGGVRLAVQLDSLETHSELAVDFL